MLTLWVAPPPPGVGVMAWVVPPPAVSSRFSPPHALTTAAKPTITAIVFIALPPSATRSVGLPLSGNTGTKIDRWRAQSYDRGPMGLGAAHGAYYWEWVELIHHPAGQWGPSAPGFGCCFGSRPSKPRRADPTNRWGGRAGGRSSGRWTSGRPTTKPPGSWATLSESPSLAISAGTVATSF